ncbi:efflux RND transporter periplasmic adaptor subunit [Tundrisphaera sp. TA3]|uniref:efflux RND transporter periplasmic adaptor subunit n=1 Tax=Tundrisphaera sp. TA3 TaxID=3435775 RepID=UPI003EB78BB3
MKIVPPEPPSVRLVPVADEVVASGTSYSAVVREFRKAELSFRVGGTVESLLQVAGPGGGMRDVHAGDRVEKGTVLARLDPADHRRDRAIAAERLAAAEGRLVQAEADAGLARLDHGRIERLVARNSATSSDLDNARARLHTSAAAVVVARREVEGARAGLQQADANLDYCMLAAPFDGATVAARAIETYERVAAHQAAFTLLDLSRVVIGFGVPDTLVGRLAIGQPIVVTADALAGETFDGVIYKIGSTADERTRSYPVEVRIDDPRGLRPGMVATAHFRRERKARLLPLTAITVDNPDRHPAVYRVAREDGRDVARQVPVAFDDVLDNRVVLRMDSEGPDRGLHAGDRVVATGVHRLRDGEPVHVAD